MTDRATRCSIVPPYILERIAQHHPDNAVRERVQATLRQDTNIRSLRASLTAQSAAINPGPFVVHDAHHGPDLPGDLVRSAGDPPSGEQAVDEAYAGVEATLALY